MSIEFRIDPTAKIAPFRQITEQLRAAIISGSLAPQVQLPSVREMATMLSVNPLTVARAMNELEAAGLIESRWGKGNFVKPISDARRENDRHKSLEKAADAYLAIAKRLGFTAKQAATAVRDVNG